MLLFSVDAEAGAEAGDGRGGSFKLVEAEKALPSQPCQLHHCGNNCESLM